MKNTLKKLVIALTLMLCATTTVVGTGAFLFYNEVGSDAGPIIRDFLMLVACELHEDDPVQFEFDISYDYVELTQTGPWFSAQTNSQWLYEMVEKIMPYLSYEGVIDLPLFPRKMGIEPYGRGKMSLHIAGWAIPSQRKMYINEWYAEELGLEEVFGTIVHELIHCQGNLFAEGTTQELEAHTVAATVEVIAGMCLRGDEVACQAFWVEIRDLAGRSFTYRMEKHDLQWLSELLKDIFFRDAKERAIAEKTIRDKDLIAIRRDINIIYGSYPWEQYVIPGVKGQPMQVKEEYGWCRYYTQACGTLHMNFDDTREMLGIWVILLGGNDDTGETDR